MERPDMLCLKRRCLGGGGRIPSALGSRSGLRAGRTQSGARRSSVSDWWKAWKAERGKGHQVVTSRGQKAKGLPDRLVFPEGSPGIAESFPFCLFVCFKVEKARLRGFYSRFLPALQMPRLSPRLHRAVPRGWAAGCLLSSIRTLFKGCHAHPLCSEREQI